MPHVLIIEDDVDLRRVLADVLESEGYTATQADEGGAGLKAARIRRPDVVLSDIIMEGMEGIAVIMALRKLFSDVPILAISGNAMYLDNSAKLGADDVLLKPFSRENLLQSLERLLQKTSLTA
jgi:CheY-like chemotaxis protein